MRLSHHLHLRKRAQHHRGLDPFPAHTWQLRLLDRIVLIAGILGPLMTFPQIVKIFAFQDAAGVSLLTWGMYTLLDIPWVVYGVVHKTKPILITYILWFVLNGLVCTGILLYGNGSF